MTDLTKPQTTQDPFDSVEISTKRAAKNKEKRNLTQQEMSAIECSAEQRNHREQSKENATGTHYNTSP